MEIVTNTHQPENLINLRNAAPMVSAIISTYNSELFMRSCMEDLIGQTLFAAGQLEIIVVDSCSPQNEKAIVEEFQQKFPNIVYIRTKERETIFAAWNRALLVARGRLITYVCTDDPHRPDALEQMARALDANPQADVVYGDSYVTCEPNAGWGKASIKGRFFWPDFDVRLLFDVCNMGPQPLWRRSVHDRFGPFDPDYRSAGDYEYWLRLAAAGCKMVHLPDVVGLYLERPDSVSLSDGNLNWRESEKARNRYWPVAWGPRPATKWYSCEKPVASLPGAKPLRVLIACDYFWPSVGGVELYVEDLGKNLQAAGCAVEVACRSLQERSATEHAGLKIHQFECVNQHGFALTDAAATRLHKLLAGKKFDCVIVLSQPNNWLAALVWTAKNAGLKVVFLPSINETDLNQWRQQGLIDKMAGLLKVPGELVAVTEHGRDMQFINEAGRVATYIPHAVEQDADGQNFRRRAGLDPDLPLLVMVANFWPVKNHLELLNVLQRSQGDWQLAIIGHRIGHFGEYSDQVARQAALDPRVKLLGGLPRAVAASAIRDADLLLVPSKGESAGPLVVLQAMSYGTAWIATPQCNAVADEAGGMVAELNKFPEAIRALLAAPAKRRELGQAGHEHWGRCFTWKQSIPAFLSILRGNGYVPNLRMPADLREKNLAIQKEIAGSGGWNVTATQLPSSPAPTGGLLVSVVIPTYNRSATLMLCLEALARQTVPVSQFEVIVSDDGSTDDTAARVEACHAPFALRYLRQKNSGPAAARNRAIEQARGHYLFILNDDAVLEPDAMALHLATHQNHLGEKIAVLGRFSFPSTLTAAPFGYALEHSDLLFTYVHLKAGGKHDYNSFFTCNISLPRQAVLDAGLFDEIFTGPAAEDIELGYRLFQRGYEVVYEPRCVAWHHHDMTPEGFCRVHHTRGEGAITLMLKQPDAPLYRGTDFAALPASLDNLKKKFPSVKSVVSLLNKVNADAVPDAKTLNDRAEQMVQLLRFLQCYHELEGMLASPRLPELIELRRKRQQKISDASPAPIVSVIIPCYNYAHLLTEAVESVLQQTFQGFEIIIVNDGSPDDTVEVANHLIRRDAGNHRIKLISQANSGQPAAARNTGIKAAVGEYILPLDADDKIAPDFLEKTVAVLRSSPEIGVAYTHIQHFGAIQSVYTCGPFEAAVLAQDNVLPYCALYRRRLWEKVGGYPLMGYEDWDFWLTLAERGCQGRLVPEPLFCYRKHERGMLSQFNQKRQRLLAQIIRNHPKLYAGAGQKTVQELPQKTPAGSTRVPLRVTYLITSILGVTGGNQTLLRQAEEMRRRGHDVTIVTYTPKPDWFRFQMRVIQAPPGQPLAGYVPPSDVVVATYFVNAPELMAVKAPVKIYYAQGDQFIFNDTTMADTAENRQWRKLSRASYELPGIRFVPNSRNLAQAVQALCGRRPDAILPVCTDQTIFRPLRKSAPGSRCRILIVGPDARGTAIEPLLFKGIADIHDGLQILARQYPHFTAVRMSSGPPDIFARFPCEYYIAPDDETKTALFGLADILVYASHYDSCPRPPQEAMAAGCAVICTATAGALEYCRDGENALLIPVKSPEAIAGAVERLVRDPALREKLAAGGLATAREYPREREWNEWENILYKFMGEAAGSVPAKPAKSAAGIVLPPCALEGHLGPARELLNKKNLRAVCESACAALKVRPFHPEAWLLIGKAAQAAGDSVSARQCGQRAAQFAPDWKPARQFLKTIRPGNSKAAWLALPPGVSENTPPRLTVCLIVKNEERFLARCLRSVRDIARQIIVVDTGSTDKTVAIAREFKAEVYSFAWNDDFSAARNEALRHATGDWILSLDADEELLPEHQQTILQEMQSAKVIGYRLPILNEGLEAEGCSYVPRLFRNAPGLFFVGRVHEQVFSSIEVRAREWGLEHCLGRSVLLHHGYTSEMVASRDKVARNLRLLKLATEELPDEPNLVMNLGLETIRSGRLVEGLGYYREALRLMAALPPKQIMPELRETLLTQLTTSLLGARRHAEIEELWREPYVKSFEMTASQHFMLGLACMELKQPAAAAEHMRACLANRAKPALSPVNKQILTAAPGHCLALSLVALQQGAKAEQAFREALAEDPKSRPARFDFARFLFQQGRPLDALKQLNELVAEHWRDAQAWRLGGQIALSKPEFLQFAQDWTAEAIKNVPSDPFLLLQRAEVLTLSQKPDLALPLWARCLSSDSPRQLAALTLCEILSGVCERRFDPAAEKSVSQEFLKWYRQLIRFQAASVVKQINARLEDLRAILPGAAGVLDAALKTAGEAMAV